MIAISRSNSADGDAALLDAVVLTVVEVAEDAATRAPRCASAFAARARMRVRTSGTPRVCGVAGAAVPVATFWSSAWAKAFTSSADASVDVGLFCWAGVSLAELDRKT